MHHATKHKNCNTRRHVIDLANEVVYIRNHHFTLTVGGVFKFKSRN